MEGIISKWIYEKGFGFIDVSEKRKDVFCHSFDVNGAYDLDPCDRVRFDVEETKTGLKAVNVKIFY